MFFSVYTIYSINALDELSGSASTFLFCLKVCVKGPFTSAQNCACQLWVKPYIGCSPKSLYTVPSNSVSKPGFPIASLLTALGVKVEHE